MFNVIQFLVDHEIEYKLSTEYANTNCVFCDDRKMHMGWSLKGTHVHCWKCGTHKIHKAIKAAVGGKSVDVNKIIEKYKSEFIYRKPEQDNRVFAKEMKLPGRELKEVHRRYLKSRNFDPDYLVKKYSIRGTDPVEHFNHINFGSRIIIPIRNREGHTISFQGRDVSGKSLLRYLGCPDQFALAPYKETLYNLNNASGNTIVLLEGVFDVWRLGDGFVCSFGTSLTNEQVRALADFQNIKILFDPEPLAQKKAKSYANQLASLGRNVENVCLDFQDGRDPGDLTEKEALQLKTILGMM